MGGRTGDQMEKELLVPGRSGDRRGRGADTYQPVGLSLCGRFGDDGVVDCWIGNEAMLTDLVAAGFELGLHQRHNIRSRGQQGWQHGENVAE